MLVNSSNESISDETASPFLSIMVGVTTAITFLLNLPVIIIMISRQCRRKKVTNIHILSLSISDLLTSVNVIPIYLSYTGRFVSYDDCFNRIVVFLVCLIASVIHLCFICSDRCWILSRWRAPTSMRNSRLRFWVIIAAAWIISPIAVGIPFVINRKQIELSYCSFSTLFENRGTTMLKWWSLLLLGVTVFICGSCAWMIWKLYTFSGDLNRRTTKVTRIQVLPMPSSSDPQPGSSRTSSLPRSNDDKAKRLRYISLNAKEKHTNHLKFQNGIEKRNYENNYQQWRNLRVPATCVDTLKTNPQRYLDTSKSLILKPNVSRMSPKRHRQAVVTILIMVSLYIVSFTPFIVMILFLEGWREFIIPRQFRHIAVYFTCINSAFNPVIYAFRIPEVRGCIRFWKERIICTSA